MGFFDAMRKIVMGEPMFKVPPQPGQQNQPAQTGQEPQQTEQKQIPHNPITGEPIPEQHYGPKVLPQVMIERWLCEPHGDGLKCELKIRNYSAGPVTLQRIEVMGLRDELGRTVDAGEMYEFLFTLPNRMKNTNLDECRLYFRNELGDYFMALHQVEYDKLPDGTYNVRRFRLLPPIRDV